MTKSALQKQSTTPMRGRALSTVVDDGRMGRQSSSIVLSVAGYLDFVEGENTVDAVSVADRHASRQPAAGDFRVLGKVNLAGINLLVGPHFDGSKTPRVQVVKESAL